MTRTIHLTRSGMLLVCLSLVSVRATAQDDTLAEEAAPGVLANEPQTAEETFDAVLTMQRVSRPDLAKRYLGSLLRMELDDETLLELREQHGTATFLRLSLNEQLQPESTQLLRRLERASATQLQDPANFDRLIAGLQGTPREREAALRDLKHYGADAVPEILDRLGAGTDFAENDRLLFTLVKFGPVAVDPLLGALDAPNPRTRAIAIDTLGFLGDESVVPRLWYPALGADQPQVVQEAALRAISRIRFGEPHFTDRLDPVGAADEIFQQAIQHFRGDFPWTAENDGRLFVWSWNNSQNKLVKTATTPASASLLMAEKLARQALLMAPERDLHRALFLASSLAHARHRAGWDQPMPVGPGSAYNLALFSGPALTATALGLAVEHRNAAAAESAATALGTIGSRDLLRSQGNRHSPLIAALDFPSDRVQFAAASAVLQLEPVESFPHSQRVIDILARSLRSDSGPHSVIIDPNTNRGVDTASVLSRLGFTTSVALTGKEGFLQAASRGDVALAVLHPNTIRWELSQTIANLRADSRTAGIPIVIAADDGVRRDMLRVLERVPSSTFVSTNLEVVHWQAQIQPLLDQAVAPPLTPQQQEQRMQTAAYLLRSIAQSSQADIFDLTAAEEALAEVAAHPLVGYDAIAALGAIGRTTVQQRFIDIISAPAIEADLQVAAARQLAQHIQRYGRLITDDGIRALADVWSNTTNPSLRTSLSSVLGVLKPTPEAVYDKLIAHPIPDVPLPTDSAPDGL